MNLFQVRKGQFVYYNNELHKVYAVKPMYKQSVHLIRLKDLTQHLCSAKEVEKYQPQALDSFIFNKKAYTLNKAKAAKVGDIILVTNPNPDYLDHYTLNEIEVVARVEDEGVITNNSNGIKHTEYLLMAPGREENSHPIDFRDAHLPTEDELKDSSTGELDENLEPSIGDVYKKMDSQIESMVIAIHGNTVFLGGGFQLPKDELLDSQKWFFFTVCLIRNLNDVIYDSAV